MPKGDNNRKLSDADRQAIVHEYTTPLPDGTWVGAKTLAAKYHINDTAIYYVLQRAGVQTRNARESHAHGKRCKPVKNLPPKGEQAPLCRCGCGQTVEWHQRKNQWSAYVRGHHQPHKPHHDREWLFDQYVTQGKSTPEIARECGVYPSTITRFLKKLGIPARNASASKVGLFAGERNPAWKGGIAKWSYAPAWKRIARVIRKRDSYTCQICHTAYPKRSRYLHVHHVDGDKFNNDPTNLVTVCAGCHPRGKRKEHYTLHDPGARRRYLVTRKGEVFGYDQGKYLTTTEAAERLGVKVFTITDMMKRARFPVIKQGWFWYIEREPFERFAQQYQPYKKRYDH